MKSRIPAPPADNALARIVERPDGFYWQNNAGGREYGPFSTLRAASEDMDSAEAAIDAGESLEEAESEIGISDWIDPETGQPAEESIPHIVDR